MGFEWDRRFFASTRGRIVELLRRNSRTVEELARALELTDNAVRGQLAALERDRLVAQQGTRRGIGKPSFEYGLTPDAEALFPKAYAPVLVNVLKALEEKLDAAELDQVLRSAGRRMAPAGKPAQGDTATRLAAAVDLLNDLGGLAELQRDDEGYIIRGYSCPLAAMTADHPEACHLAESLISAAIDLPLAECCEHGDQPRCCFRPAPAA